MKFPVGKQSSNNYFFAPKNFQSHTLVLVILSLFFASWFFMYYRHTNKRIQLYNQEINTLKKQQNSLSSNKQMNKKLGEKINELKNNLNFFSTDLPFRNRSLPQSQMIAIARAAQKIGLVLESCIAQKEKNKDWFFKQNVTYNVRGKTKEIALFVNKIKKLGSSFKCKKFVFNKTQDLSAHLECVLQLLTFSSKFQSV